MRHPVQLALDFDLEVVEFQRNTVFAMPRTLHPRFTQVLPMTFHIVAIFFLYCPHGLDKFHSYHRFPELECH